MLIKPKIDYGCECYSSASKTLLESISPIQNCAIRIATGAFRSSPILSLHSESGLKPISIHRELKILNFYTRVFVNPSHPMSTVVLRDWWDDEDEDDVDIDDIEDVTTLACCGASEWREGGTLGPWTSGLRSGGDKSHNRLWGTVREDVAERWRS
jgi:hypothetical protein